MSKPKLQMEDRGVSKEKLYDMYITKNMSQGSILEELKVSEGVFNRWLKECGIDKKKGKKYNFNIKFFDSIDTEEKAYWLGFVWCDGYASTRVRGGRVTERPVKISLSSEDRCHLEKLRKSIESNHPIHIYKVSGFGGEYEEARLTLNNSHFGKKLQEDYGMIPHRSDISKVIKAVPESLERHFLRGIFDAEGSLTSHYLHSGNNKGQLKSTLTFSTYSELVDWIQEYMIRNNIKDSTIKTQKRHGEDSDGDCVSIFYSGVQQAHKISKHLYKEASIFMKRKHDRFTELEEMIANREEKKNV